MRVLQWVLDNLFTVLIIAGVVAQLIQAVKGKKGGDEEAGPTVEPPKEFEFEDPELAERTRRIREDIRRKIAQRQAGGTPEDEPEMEPAPEPAAFEEPPPVVREVAVERPAPAMVASSRMDAQRQAEVLEQQAALMDKLRQLEETKAAALRRAAFEASTVSPAAAARTQARGAVIEDLRNPAALRRAFVLREIIGPPVGLR